MIIFLYGRDVYRLKQNLSKIIETYKNKHATGMSFYAFDASGEQGNKILGGLEEVAKTTSFFKEKRLIIIKNPFMLGKNLASFLKKWGIAEDKERIIIFTEHQNETELKKLDKSFYTTLAASPNLVKNFEPLKDKPLENWLIKEVTGYNKKIDMPAVKKLIACTGGDMWLLSQEINKLTNYKNNDQDNNINTGDIENIVRSKENLNIFELVDAIANKNSPRAIKLLHDHMESGIDPYYVFSMVTYQFRNLIRVKDLAKNAVPYASIIKSTALNPYVVKKTYDQSRKFELDELKKLFARLAHLDISTKKGETDMAEALYSFVFSLTS